MRTGSALPMSQPNAMDYTEQTVFTGVEAGPGACQCSCDCTAACSNGTLTAAFGPGCGSSYMGAVDTACHIVSPVPLPSAYQASYTPGSSCTPQVLANDAGLSVLSATTCLPFSSCSADLCNGSFSSGPSCISSAGDVPCPPGPFQVRQVVGMGTALACTACACPGTVTCFGSIDYFTDQSCTSLASSFQAGAPCTSPDASPTVNSYHWHPTDGGADAQGPMQGAASLTGLQTICCR
jgi:hypothetical protein